MTNADVPDRNVGDLISRQAALGAIDKNRQDLLSLGMDGAEHILVHYGRRVIEEQPTIDPAKHGRWEFEPGVMYCSVCGWIFEYYAGLEEEWNYCPHCGARMRGEEDE